MTSNAYNRLNVGNNSTNIGQQASYSGYGAHVGITNQHNNHMGH